MEQEIINERFETTSLAKENELLKQNSMEDDDFWEWYENNYDETKRELYARFHEWQDSQTAVTAKDNVA